MSSEETSGFLAQQAQKNEQKKRKKFNPRARSLARQRALQALYQWRLGNIHSCEVIETQFLEEQDMKGVDIDYFKLLLHQVVANAKKFDQQLPDWLDRPLDQLDPIEHVVLHMGLYELQYCDVPWRVAINESVELAKRFGATASHKYINGILDKAARALGK